MKSAALAMTTFGAFCMITRIDIDDVVQATSSGLFILVAASALCALAVPDIGVDHSWMHNGQWQGVYELKQTLGFVGAYLMFFSCYRKMTGQGWLAFLVAFLLASTCVLASELRGAGAVALAACALLVTSMWSVGCMRLYAILPFVMCVMAGFLIVYFYATGYDAIHIGDATVNFTERTFIWHYAISHFDDAPLLGFGINGFWTIPSIYDYFEQNHGWVLDNYHSGYIAILMETGFLGYVLFAASVLLFSNKALYLISALILSIGAALCPHHRICRPQLSDQFHRDDVPSLDHVHVGAPRGVPPCNVQAGAGDRFLTLTEWKQDLPPPALAGREASILPQRLSSSHRSAPTPMAPGRSCLAMRQSWDAGSTFSVTTESGRAVRTRRSVWTI